MKQTVIFWPMIAHVLLVCIVYVLLSLRRRAAVQTGAARMSQFKLNGQEPEISAAVSNNLKNQFELPVLFHVACLAFFVTGTVSGVVVALAWLFVALRYVHAYVHVTSNDMRVRSPVFALGFLVLVVLWACFAVRLPTAG